MKNKVKYLLISIILLLCISNPVHAGSINVTGGFRGTRDTGITASNGAGTQSYKEHDFYIMYNGVEYKAYCKDPGYSLNSSNVEMTCSSVTEPSMAWLIDNLSGDYTTDLLAVRMLSVRLGINKNPGGANIIMAGVVNYVWAREASMGRGPIYGNIGIDYNKYLYGSGSIDSAYNLAMDAYYNHNNYIAQGNPTINVNSHVTENHVTATVTSTEAIAASNINFACENCDNMQIAWNGTSGTITFDVKVPNCSYTLKVYTLANGTYLCQKDSMQDLITKIRVAEGTNVIGQYVSTTGTPTKTFVGSITEANGGSYYQQYCAHNDLCNQKTQIEIPSYCDDESDKQITITAPDDIKYCILNEKDEAGNTYQMLDGQIRTDNPYCAVYCKEDYEMTLPGARFTTSGRYFSLTDTTANATRTCYATNTKGDPTKGTNIDIEKFISDVQEKQKAVINARDAYLKAVAEKAAEVKTEYGEKCDGSKPTYSKKDSVDYTGVEAECNNSDSTGICSAKSATHQTSSYTWGTIWYTTHDSNGTCHDHSNTIEEPDWDGKIASAEAAMTAAVNDLRNTLNYMQECYNWKNEFCMDPDVEFNYQEQYNTKINYTQTSQSVSKDVETLYSNQKNIDNKYTATITDNNLENPYYIYCDKNGCDYSHDITKATRISTLVSKYYHMKKTSTGTATYKNVQLFKSNYPTGTIEEIPSGATGPNYDYYYLGAIFPVAYNTPTGVYNWTLEFSKVGMYNNKGTIACSDSSLGRLNDVAEVLSDEQGISANIEYVCVYVVDCPECAYECSCGNNKDCVEKYENGQKICSIPSPEPECPECEIYCINCIFDGDSATYTYRTISLNDINPNGRTLGANWTSDKGEYVQSQIESTGEEIYKEAEYSYTLTPTQMKNIRDYNKTTGTYVSEYLNYHWSNDNIYGTSSFLDTTGTTYFTERKRNNNWETWTSYSWDENGNSFVGPSLK